jgi:hypothetical protein
MIEVGFIMASEYNRFIRESDQITNIEDAVQWCARESADVEFSDNIGVRRVWVKVTGHPVVVRETLVEAVDVLSEIVRKRRSEECQYIW